MVKFDINGTDIEFDENMHNYNKIRKEFKIIATNLSQKFESYCYENFKNTKLLFSDSNNVYEEYLNIALKRGVETLVEFDIITIDLNTFKGEYVYKYLDYDRVFNNLSKHSSINHSKNKKGNNKFYDIHSFIKSLKESVYNDCFNIHYALVDALKGNNVLNISNYIKEEDILKSNALFNNYKDGFISKPYENKVIKQIIALNPYKEDFYKFLIKEDGDFNHDIENLTLYLGYDICGYKSELMEVYVDTLLEKSYDIEDIKEKICKYAKYIGFRNESVYITRIDAISLFENA